MTNHDKINTLVKIASLEFDRSKEKVYRVFTGFPIQIAFVGTDNYFSLRNTLDDLYNYNKEISNTISYKNFEKELIKLVKYLITENRKSTNEDFQNIINRFLESPIIEHEVFHEIFGIILNIPEKNFGKFSIYNITLSEEILKNKYIFGSDYNRYFEDRKSDYFIGIKIKARDHLKAKEISFEICEYVENIFNYMIGDLKHLRMVGILNYRNWISREIITCNEKSINHSSESEIKLLIDIDDDHFLTSSNGNRQIWDLLNNENKTKIQERILKSIIWIGNGVYDTSSSKALLQFIFAIEGMLQYDLKSFISPSIVSQLSESIAFILEDETEKRKEISKLFKKLYKERSSIAHGNQKTIELEDLTLAFQLSKMLIIKLLTKKPYCSFSTIDQLNDEITNLKFR
ncbi:HEPN domain-containing protein [Kaistella sp. PBT33-4]|uniref:HEPN domain-containing protein n=1 Tax=Kaistella sp. PBT33-4 TaxID=3032000 RepID=UPI0023D81A75|nr:HEPN domain-containing protein [Kaistella sp. PBT33-4]MDF0719862.1 HEPN domain-containing protein [Kaistella sp. PBT33-4]